MKAKFEVGKCYIAYTKKSESSSTWKVIAIDEEQSSVTVRPCDEFGQEHGCEIEAPCISPARGFYDELDIATIDGSEMRATNPMSVRDSTKAFIVGRVYIGKHTDGYDIYYKAVGRDDDHEHVNLQKCTESGKPIGEPRSVQVDVDPVWSGDKELVHITLGRYTSVSLCADRFLEGQ